MTDAVETTDDVATDDVEADVADVAESDETEQVEDPTAGLQKALKAERLARRESDKKAKALEQQLADKDKPADELAIEAARREAREEAQKASDERYVKSELKAALKGRVANPVKVLQLINTSGIEVDADGEADVDAIENAIATLFADFPELAVKQARFQGGADQGTKGKAAELSQLTQSDIERMTPEQVVEARKAGRLNKLMGVS